jgi:hypothetical protein
VKIKADKKEEEEGKNHEIDKKYKKPNKERI